MYSISKKTFVKLPKKLNSDNSIDLDEETIKDCVRYIEINNSKITKEIEKISNINPEVAEEMESKTRVSYLSTIHDLFDFELNKNKTKDKGLCR